MARRILVTGAAGFLGGAVVRRLAERDDVEIVLATDRIADEGASAGKVRWIRRDVCAPADGLLRDHGVEAIVHHAFEVRPPRDRDAAHRVNVEAVGRLLRDARAAGVGRIVYPSSTTVYGAWPDTGFHDEQEQPRPLPGFAYSEHKVEAERLLLAGPSEAPTTIVLRGCVVVGPGSDNFILSSLALPLFPCPAGADPPMQFLHVDDYTTAVEAALNAPRSGIFNVAGSGTIRLRELVAAVGSRAVAVPEPLLRRIIDLSWRLRLQNRSPSNGLALIRHPWLASIDRIESELGWRPHRSSAEAVAAWSAARPGGRRRSASEPG